MDRHENTANIFNKYASEYEAKYMDVSLYAQTLDVLLNLIQNGNAEVLEIGCGPGNLSKYLSEKQPGWNLTGIDIAEKMVALAQKNNPKADFQVLDARKIDKINHKFDAVIAGFLLPYLSKEESEEFILKCSRTLKKGGLLYLSFMEGAYVNSGFVGSSQDNKEQLFTFYHDAQYLKSYLEVNGFEIVHSAEIHNENNKPGVGDRVLISKH
ncbi:MAG: class I SAM-dependent methyltransferase [Christiangramia sp.]|nr:class I SAM-dependent methyltransferase [Christiangramia sp.]